MTSTHDISPELTPAIREAIAQSRTLFNTSVGEVRPRLHRFCARMCGSSLDGEDLVQKTLADAFYSLSTLRDATRLEPWMFRIVYHKCIDFLRRERSSMSRSDSCSMPMRIASTVATGAPCVISCVLMRGSRSSVRPRAAWRVWGPRIRATTPTCRGSGASRLLWWMVNRSSCTGAGQLATGMRTLLSGSGGRLGRWFAFGTPSMWATRCVVRGFSLPHSRSHDATAQSRSSARYSLL